MLRNSVLIIPSLNPGMDLVSYVTSLVSNGFQKIILVDDGSTDAHKSVFKTLRKFPECEILVHAVNLGKGRALKDAFNYYLNHFSAEYKGVITADSDGQHTVEDVLKLDYLLGQYPDSLILGTRDFSLSSVPLKSRFGNKLTRGIMKFLIWGGYRKPIPAYGQFPTTFFRRSLRCMGSGLNMKQIC